MSKTCGTVPLTPRHTNAHTFLHLHSEIDRCLYRMLQFNTYVHIFSSISQNNTHLPICTLLSVSFIISPFHTGCEEIYYWCYFNAREIPCPLSVKKHTYEGLAVAVSPIKRALNSVLLPSTHLSKETLSEGRERGKFTLKWPELGKKTHVFWLTAPAQTVDFHVHWKYIRRGSFHGQKGMITSTNNSLNVLNIWASEYCITIDLKKWIFRTLSFKHRFWVKTDEKCRDVVQNKWTLIMYCIWQHTYSLFYFWFNQNKCKVSEVIIIHL